MLLGRGFAAIAPAAAARRRQLLLYYSSGMASAACRSRRRGGAGAAFVFDSGRDEGLRCCGQRGSGTLAGLAVRSGIGRRGGRLAGGRGFPVDGDGNWMRWGGD